MILPTGRTCAADGSGEAVLFMTTEKTHYDWVGGAVQFSADRKGWVGGWAGHLQQHGKSLHFARVLYSNCTRGRAGEAKSTRMG